MADGYREGWDRALSRFVARAEGLSDRGACPLIWPAIEHLRQVQHLPRPAGHGKEIRLAPSERAIREVRESDM